MDIKSKRKELLKMDDRDLVKRILAFPDRERLNRDADGNRRPYPSAEMAVHAKRQMDNDPDYKISEKQRFAMCSSFAEHSVDELKVVGIKFAGVDPKTLNIGKRVSFTNTENGAPKEVYNLTYHLKPEPENERDKNAVAVYVVNNESTDQTVVMSRIGYLPASYVAEHPITQEMTAAGTLTNYSPGTFKVVSYSMALDTEAIDRDLNSRHDASQNYTYRMPFLLNGTPKEGTADYLNDMYWSENKNMDNWTMRLNDELEYYRTGGTAQDVRFEFPGGKTGNIIVETTEKFNDEAINVCGSYFRYILEAGISSTLKRDGYIEGLSQTQPAVNTRERTYFSLQAEPGEKVNESGMTDQEEEDFMRQIDAMSGDIGPSLDDIEPAL